MNERFSHLKHGLRRVHLWVLLLCWVAMAGSAVAQFQLRGGSFNSLRQSGVPVDPGSTVVTPQFAGKATTAASSGPVSDATEPYDRYPSGKQVTGVTVTGGIILRGSGFGGMFASGVPRYALGDVITPPVSGFGTIGEVSPEYWRARPVEDGETFVNPGSSTPVLANPAPAAPPYTFYYSPHAKKVFAHQSGRVSITWVTQQPVAADGDPSGSGPKEFRFKQEVFSVASGTSQPIRRIYWTERGFNGPQVNIPSGRIVTVNPVYNTFFPATVAEEFDSVGSVPADPSASQPPELRTLWFERTAGIGQMKAYNQQGRILVEYLGTLEGPGVHEFLGADIVEVVQAAQSTTAEVRLGDQIQAFDSTGLVAPEAGDLIPSAVQNLNQDSITYFGTSAQTDGSLIYHAEWATNNPDKVTFYWLETSDAAIHEGESPELGISWPKYLNKYRLVWPGSLDDYVGVTTQDAGSRADTGISFSGGAMPEVVYQDDPAQTEASVDLESQRLLVDFSASTDRTNRSLLKFSMGDEVWYVRLYVQSESILGSPAIPAVPDPDGNGPLQGTPEIPAVFTLADRDADGVRDLSVAAAGAAFQVEVGQRIERPSDAYAVAGFISAGTGYHPTSYLDPLSVGVEAASAGAILPVNAVPGDNELTIWWLEQVTAPSGDFSSFHVPSVSATYAVSYPTSVASEDQLVLASNLGSGVLPPEQAAGRSYFQNDSSQPGYNPNEEHALIISGRAYALRDDLNVTNGSGYSSQPFLLLSYDDPADGRPSMRVLKVVREDVGNGWEFDYPVTAGATVPAPMPLPLLPVPLDADGNGLNREVTGAPDPAPDASAPARYDSFTFQDRKGFTKVCRGPHDGGTPTMGMQFYYAMQEGFFVPGESSQPEEGTPLPYLRPLSGGDPVGDAVTGSPLTVVYRPSWPEVVPELRLAETLTLQKFGLPQVRGQSSVEVLYQQSIALKGDEKPSVVLHDPTRAKTVLFSTQSLDALPGSAAITGANGRTYFQRLAPHLQQRFYVESAGSDFRLVLEGEFVDEIAGEDYLNLNVLSEQDEAALKGIVDAADGDKSKWDSAIDALATDMLTYAENPAKRGSYEPGPATAIDAKTLAEVEDSDTAVDSYALTATGQGSGYVSLIFGDGEAFTPEGDPISIAVLRVAPQLYVGDMKVLLSSNPLDEQVSLRHSGDFAAKPEDYEFEWRYAPGSEVPPVYAYGAPVTLLGASTSWDVTPFYREQGEDITAAAVTSVLPVAVVIRDTSLLPVGGDPVNLGIEMTAVDMVDFSAGLPAQVIFSADLASDLDGLVLFVNGAPAVVHRAPDTFTATPPGSGLSPTGLTTQFNVSPSFFREGPNQVRLQLFSSADLDVASQVNFQLETVSKIDVADPEVHPSSPWLKPSGTLLNLITIGGSPTAPLGDPLLLMQDNSFTVRYRPLLSSGNVLTEGVATQEEVPWSDWMEPKPVPGWVKRVLDAINPFNQRVTDLFNNSVNTDVSVLTQAGTRWEGDIALTLDNIDDVGLIEIYETVLNRAKLFTIDNGYDNPGANDALLLAAGYLNDLYLILGNEAYADAANPTISLDDQETITEVNSSRFSFEGQVSTSLQEELALLRGRDDFLSTSVATAPAYNRLYWNYTNGIDSGEVLYATNYNITEKVGSATQDGVIDAADAQRMFPQAHGDAYGHYLTALKGYYKLLTNDHFTWIPRSENVLVLGQAVAVDYQDERKFAAAAAQVARTSEQVLSLTYRESYRDDPSAGWSHLRDNELNDQTNVRRHWGVDEWASRVTNGAYLNWVVGNAILPDVDEDPSHTGIEVVDRTTVPEPGEVAASSVTLQSLLDNANAKLNPLGLSPGAIAFDISPTDLQNGHSHFEQVYDRALASILNAKGSFDQAGRMTRLLRNQANQIDDYNTAIEEQERAFRYQLIDLFGVPYSGDIGVGKPYAQGYSGPDLINWFLIDQASDLVDVSQVVTTTINQPVNVPDDFSGDSISEIYTLLDTDSASASFETFTVTVEPSQIAQRADSFFGSNAGQRRVTGEIQTALQQDREAQMLLLDSLELVRRFLKQFEASHRLFQDMVETQNAVLAAKKLSADQLVSQLRLQKGLEGAAVGAEHIAEGIEYAALGFAEYGPIAVGFSNDVSSVIRGTAMTIGTIASSLSRLASVGATVAAGQIEADNVELDLLNDVELTRLGFDQDQRQFIYEFELLFNEVIDQAFNVAILAGRRQQTAEHVRNVLARGDRILAEREIFRLRAAAIIQGYRTRDVAFRTFRNEALEQYRTLFDLGARYTYLAAKSYDYETGLLGTAQGQEVIDRIVASRALGDLTNGVPQATTSTLGDAGLAGAMAQMNADFTVAKGRLGINNPDPQGTLFSLRHELFRILQDDTLTADDETWQQTLEQHIVSDLMGDADVARYCNNLRKPDGSRVPGILIPFSSTIDHENNFFGLPKTRGDHFYSPSRFATKIHSVGVVLDGYVGMDPYAIGVPGAGGPASNDPDALTATPYVYLIPCGEDFMRAPALGDTNTIRSWSVHDQALPLPYNLGATDFNETQFFDANGTLTEQPWIVRKHQGFRPVNDPAFFFSRIPQEFTNRRLIGRSVWNSR
jgi:hypothetical protein